LGRTDSFCHPGDKPRAKRMPVRVDNMPVLCGLVGWHLLSPWFGRDKGGRSREVSVGALGG
jgi:hypothetical protein